MSDNRLTFIENAGRDGFGQKVAKYNCKCGNIIITSIWHVNNNYSRSCGCLRKARQIESNTKHGLNKSKEYTAWIGMKGRCYAINNKRYHDYGGRGIKVCDRWLESFENFFEDMGPKPTNEHSLDRIDNNKDYYPENCRWATKKEQSNNTRMNKILEYNGESHTIAEWSDKIGIAYNVLSSRLQRNWTIERALNTPNIQKIPRNKEGKFIKYKAGVEMVEVDYD